MAVSDWFGDSDSSLATSVDALESITPENLKNALQTGNYLKDRRTLAAAIPLADIASDVASTGATLAGYGIAQNLYALFEVNALAVSGVAAFITNFYRSVYGDGVQQAWTTQFAEASATLSQAGVFAWFYALLQVLLMIAFAVKLWEVYSDG
jgi:hypothetical protein